MDITPVESNTSNECNNYVPEVKIARLRTDPAIQAKVVARYTQGIDKAKIAREFGIKRDTVTSILMANAARLPDEVIDNHYSQIADKARLTIETQIANGDGKLALQFLHYLHEKRGRNNVTRGPSGALSALSALIPGGGRVALAIEAAAKPGGADLGLNSRTQNFSESKPSTRTGKGGRRSRGWPKGKKRGPKLLTNRTHPTAVEFSDEPAKVDDPLAGVDDSGE